MNYQLINIWLKNNNLVLEQSFTSAIRELATAYKKNIILNWAKFILNWGVLKQTYRVENIILVAHNCFVKMLRPL